MSISITQCLHAALQVSSLERAEFFYGTVLGLVKLERSLKFPGAWYEVAGFQLHLMAVDSPELQNPELQNPDKWGRNPHIAFAVSDLDAAKTELLKHGCPIQVSASGRSALFTRDPDGNVIELSAAPAG
jgi:glyoxylase I family protein